MEVATSTTTSNPPVKHYPLAIADKIKVALARATTPAQREQIIERLDPLMRLPLFQYRPLPKANQFHRSQKKFRWCLGGNRSSKSHSVAQEVLWFATGTHPFRKIVTPNTGWYSTDRMDMVGDILWNKVEPLLTGFEYKVIWRYRPKNIPDTVEIKVPGGVSKIVFKSYEQRRESYQGTDRRWIANDEQFPQDIYLEQISRIGADVSLDFFCAMTPIIAQPWLEERLTQTVPPEWDVFEYPLDDNRISRGGFIADEDIDRLIEEWPEEVQPTRRLGKWSSFIGAVYKSFRREIHVVSEENERLVFFPRGKPAPDIRSIGSIDWGANNPFVFLLACKLPHVDNEWYIYDEYYWDGRKHGTRLIRDHAKEIKKMCAKWETGLIKTWADHDAQDRFEMSHEGIHSHPAVKEIQAGIETVQRLFKVRETTQRPRLHFAARCKHLISEIIALHYSEGTENRSPDDDPVKVNDHAADALRYLIHSEEGTNGVAPPLLNLDLAKRRF